MNNKPVLAFLDITTWAELSIGGMHYYGSLKWEGCEHAGGIKVTKPLTPEEAEKLSENRSVSGLLCAYEAWEYTEIFDSYIELAEAALNTYREIVPDANYLIEGSPSIGDPQCILDGVDVTVIEKANKLYEEFEDINGFGCNKEDEPKAESLFREWDKLLQKGWRDST